MTWNISEEWLEEGNQGKEGKQSSNVAIKKKVEEYAARMVPLVPLVP
jgi:hypothetical protein